MQTFIALEKPFEELQHDELPRGFKVDSALETFHSLGCKEAALGVMT